MKLPKFNATSYGPMGLYASQSAYTVEGIQPQSKECEQWLASFNQEDINQLRNLFSTRGYIRPFDNSKLSCAMLKKCLEEFRQLMGVEVLNFEPTSNRNICTITSGFTAADYQAMNILTNMKNAVVA